MSKKPGIFDIGTTNMAPEGGLHLISPVLLLNFVTISGQQTSETQVLGIFPGDSSSKYIPGESIQIESESGGKLRLIGTGLKESTHIFFTPSNGSCIDVEKTRTVQVKNNSKETSVLIDVQFRTSDALYYLCTYDTVTKEYQHAGSEPWITVKAYDPEEPLIPFSLTITLLVILLMLSGMFSGLTLGLMSLNQTELTIIQKVGSESEKKYARRIAPLRARGNLLLCTLLLGNTMVNNTFTILNDSLTNGYIAVALSTVCIVIFGEIMPQAICSRHGLAIGAKTHWLTKLFMFVTFPASYPISIILDKVLGEEMGQVYSKEKLQELIRLTADRRLLHDREANIISGALQLTNKSVEDIMTKIEDVYMLEIGTVLDFDTLSEILNHGYTRVPVYSREKTNIVNLLNTKDLALIDPDDNTLLSTVCKYYDHKPLLVHYDTKLDTMLQEFLQGNSHMAIVQKLHNAEDRDPYYENVGVVTLEDVIEEILQSEIIDETDMMTDNRRKELRPRKNREYGRMVGHEDNRSTLPRQLGFVAFQYLATNIAPFSEEIMSRNVLKKLLKKDIVVSLRASDTKDKIKPKCIYEKGVPTDKFVLIVQGTVEVIIGTTNMVFESGPFSHYGEEALKGLAETHRSKEYIPDFTVKALTDVQYLFITQADYLSALHATRMMRQSGSTLLDIGSDVDRIRTNHNQNSMFPSHSPPLCNSPLESLKDDFCGKKQSTSSLDRLAFFQRKPDPHEILNRMRRTGSDAKERSPEYQPDPRKHSMDSAHPISPLGHQEANLSSPRKFFPDPASKRAASLTSSQPFKSGSNHKLEFLPEDGRLNGDSQGVGKRKLEASKSHPASESPTIFPPPAYASLAEGESNSIPSSGPSPVASQGNGSTLVDAHVSVHIDTGHPGNALTSPEAGGGKQQQDGTGDHEMIGAGDSERIPLMQRDKKAATDTTTTENL